MALNPSGLAALLPRWPGWRHLPRETRDTLFQLAVIGWTILPHLPQLAWWCGLISLVMLLWRAQLALSHAPLPSRWALAGVLALAAGLTLWSEKTLLGKSAGVTMLVVLMALKTLELRARRDAMVIFFLGFFLVLTHFLYSQSIYTALAMLLSVWGLLTALTLAHMPAGTPGLRQAGGVALRATLLGAPLMVALFLLFPRMGPLWGVPQDAAGKTGLSGSLQLGGLADLANDDSIALRLRFFDRPPPPEAMYFRGPVLASFDGREWTRLQPTLPGSLRSELQTRGAPVRYEMTLEPNRLPTLPLLEMTPARDGAAPRIDGWAPRLRADLEWQAGRAVTERLRFEAVAWPQHRHGPRSDTLNLREFVDLPAGFNPRTLQWAADLRRRPEFQQADAATLVGEVLAHVRQGGYSYTLEPGAYGRHAVDEFWLDRKLGFCEHFASAFVVVMRALDVPARVVTGYQGTDPEPVDGWYVVRNSNAHAWAEYWQPQVGWTRVDPTAAVAPERVSRGRNLQPRAGFVANALGTVSPQLLEGLRNALEALNNRWNQSVMNYSRNSQFELLKHLGVESPDWADLAYALIGLLCAASLAGTLWALRERRRQDPWLRLQQRVAQSLGALGVAVAAHEAPRQRAAKVRAQLGAPGEALARSLDSLEQLRYAPAPEAAPSPASWWRGFHQLVRQAQRGAVGSRQ